MSEEKGLDNMGKLFQVMYTLANEINGYFKMGSITLERQAFGIITADLIDIIKLSGIEKKKNDKKSNPKKEVNEEVNEETNGKMKQELIFCGMISEKNLSKRDDMTSVLEKIIKVFLKQKIDFNLLKYVPLIELFNKNQQKIEREFINKIRHYVKL